MSTIAIVSLIILVLVIEPSVNGRRGVSQCIGHPTGTQRQRGFGVLDRKAMDDCKILRIHKSVIGNHGYSTDDASYNFIFDPVSHAMP